MVTDRGFGVASTCALARASTSEDRKNGGSDTLILFAPVAGGYFPFGAGLVSLAATTSKPSPTARRPAGQRRTMGSRGESGPG